MSDPNCVSACFVLECLDHIGWRNFAKSSHSIPQYSIPVAPMSLTTFPSTSNNACMVKVVNRRRLTWCHPKRIPFWAGAKSKRSLKRILGHSTTQIHEASDMTGPRLCGSRSSNARLPYVSGCRGQSPRSPWRERTRGSQPQGTSFVRSCGKSRYP